MSSNEELNVKRVWLFFLPLALSGLMMGLGQPIVHAGLARLPSPELTLAAYGLTFSAAILLEAPIIMLMPAANALVVDEVAYRSTRRWMLIINLFLTINAVVISCITPVYDFIFLDLLGFPHEVARAAQPGLIALVLWPIVIGIRRYYQGILIHFKKTHVVGWGSAARLVAMLITTFFGVRWFPHQGIIVGSLALMAGVIGDMAVALVGARRLLTSGVLPRESPEAMAASREVKPFAAFYVPLALTSTLMVMASPLVLSGIARSHNAELALAAWPVAMGAMFLVNSQLHMMQQVVVALVRDRATMEVVRRFRVQLAAVFFALMVLLVITPASRFYFEAVIGLVEPVLSMTNRAFGIMLVMPLVVAAQMWNQGLLIGGGRTVAVNLGALANLVLLVGGVHILAITTQIEGHLIAASLYPVAVLTEALLIRRWARPVIQSVAKKEMPVVKRAE